MKQSSRIILVLLLLSIFLKCKKDAAAAPAGNGNNNGGQTDTIIKPADPAVAATMGFFLDDWKPRTFLAPSYTEVTPVTASTTNIVTIDASAVITKIPLSVFGHNANTWMTPMINEPLFMQHITAIHPHIIRFPAGSGSDAYFWNQPQGSFPADAPAQLMDKDGKLKDPGYGYGRTANNWQASLDNYYAMLQQSGNRGMITVNYGYARYGTSADPVAAAAHLAADWVRYDNGRTSYWEIGNENYGDWEWGYRIDVSKNKDAQPEYLTGDLYGKHFRVFVDSMQKAATGIGKTIYIGATLYETQTETWQTSTTRNWNTGVLPRVNDRTDFYVVHNYFTPYNTNSNAAAVLEAANTVPAKMMNFVTQAIQTSGAAAKPVALTEWNMFATGSRQQVSNTSGLFAITIMGEVLKNRFGMAARWDLLNGWANGDDHGLFSDGKEPGIPRWTPRPSFYYMYFFQKLLGDRLVPVNVQGNSGIKAYASTYTSGQVNVTLVNTTSSAITIEVKANNFKAGNRFYWYSLEGGSDNGEFSGKVAVNGATTELSAGGPAGYASINARSTNTLNGIKVVVPALGAVCMTIDKK